MNPIGSILDLGGDYISFSIYSNNSTNNDNVSNNANDNANITILMIAFMSITYQFMLVSELSVVKDRGKGWDFNCLRS